MFPKPSKLLPSKASSPHHNVMYRYKISEEPYFPQDVTQGALSKKWKYITTRQDILVEYKKRNLSITKNYVLYTDPQLFGF